MTADKPRRLGRGLEALLSTPHSGVPVIEQSPLQRLPISQIRPNPFQPRKEFRPDELADLEASLRASGLIQPITVRRAAGAALSSGPSGGYELIAGERRLRAASRLGWTDIPAVVKDADDRTLLTLALVENLQRTDLGPLEEAEGYQRLIEEFGLTQQEVADAVGKDRSTVANTLRLLTLPASVRRMLQESQLTPGHARALLTLGDERAITELAREAVAKALSVREVERRVRGSSSKLRTGLEKPGAKATLYTAEVRRIEDQLRQRLQTDVHLTLTAKERGVVTISFYSADDLERILELVLGGDRETT